MDMPSHYSVEKIISEHTGVESIEHDMCPNTCVAFTGPYSALNRCPICEEERYDSIRLRTSGGRSHIARQKFVTIPLGPQLQALWHDPQHAEDIGYLREETRRIREQMRTNGGLIDVHQEIREEMIFLDIHYKHTSE